MCGIVGLFIKDPALEPQLGSMLAGMLEELSDRGPDSAGFALYGDGAPDSVKLTLRAENAAGAEDIAARLRGNPPVAHLHGVEARDTHLVISVSRASLDALMAHIAGSSFGARVVGLGSRMEVYKEVGPPADVTQRFGLRRMRGTHAVGHTRMATESAVTTDGAHPFSTGRDQCLVHNGSLSNHNRLRQALHRQGLVIDTENDSEVAAAYLTWRMGQGLSLGQSLQRALQDLDGFYTFVVGTEDGFGVLRDPIACKPAVMAETDGYVAFASEYRALADLPGVEHACLFEPEPAQVYFWERH
jgi:glutamate synthase domain-containing protein 1